ncbi:hypothetical protein [Naasia sp. SYSU D00948]|uniref:hypothetical protein n=1 Tax=Naasia sp. SYSU D00948 TaxID=2817379 RepID=UPI001B30B941|nr:hypothetical protein [Naasia sp. SYSU D00948]
MKRYPLVAMGASALALAATGILGAGPASANNSADTRGAAKTVTLEAQLTELNGSGASGTATAVVRNQKIQHIEVHAHGLSPDAPHAQHIHYGEQALNECPTLAQDANGDGRLNTVEGVPAYGPVVVSLTTFGDTTPGSFLDVGRFPVAENGEIHYSRDNIEFTDVAGTGYAGGTGTAKQIADAIRDGEGVVVIHGVDYDGNGEYSLSEEGVSELDGSLPAEATDPAVCGVLR